MPLLYDRSGSASERGTPRNVYNKNEQPMTSTIESRTSAQWTLTKRRDQRTYTEERGCRGTVTKGTHGNVCEREGHPHQGMFMSKGRGKAYKTEAEGSLPCTSSHTYVMYANTRHLAFNRRLKQNINQATILPNKTSQLPLRIEPELLENRRRAHLFTDKCAQRLFSKLRKHIMGKQITSRIPISM